jgi:sugar phosphate isomerase/epimerase
MNVPKIATHLSPFSTGADRYNAKGYQPALPVEEILRKAASVPGLDAVELNFRNLVNEDNASSIKTMLDQLNLLCANVSINVWGDAHWKYGSLSNPDPARRREAVELITAGMRTTRSLGCGLVSIWPAQDGFDYPFEADYARMMDWFIEGLQDCADAVPDVRICIEYKPKEPRAHLLFDNAARTLWILSKVARRNVGVLLDVGHAWCGYENAAQSAVLLHREAMLDHLHFNDNYGDWDWDMVPGTLRIPEMVELIYWLQEINYQGYYSIDIVSPRIDPVFAVTQSVKNIRRLYHLAERIDRDQFRANLASHNPIANLSSISDQMFSHLEHETYPNLK